MLGPGELDEAVCGRRGLLQGVEVCIKSRCLVPSLTLIYSSMDAVSALTRPKTAAYTSRAIFESWVSTYMGGFLCATQCSAEDIYAARCGVVHTTTRRSRLSREKAGVRTFVYYWREGPRPDATAPPARGAVQLCVEDLRDAGGLDPGAPACQPAQERSAEHPSIARCRVTGPAPAPAGLVVALRLHHGAEGAAHHVSGQEDHGPGRPGRQTALPVPSPHAAARHRLLLRQPGRGHQEHPGVPRPPEHLPHRQVHRAIARAVQGVLEGLAAPASLPRRVRAVRGAPGRGASRARSSC